MKILIYSDLHACNSKIKLRSCPQDLQIYRVNKFYKDLENIYELESCSGVWDLGDTTDDRSEISIQVMDTLLECIQNHIPDSDYNIKLIGNHEQFYKNTKSNTGRMYLNKFKVISGTKRIKFQKIDFAIHAISYPEIYEDVEKYIDSIKDKNYIIIGHLQVIGSRMGLGNLLVEGISPKVFGQSIITFLGHIHKRQIINNNILYVGAPFKQDWSMHGDSPGVTIFDTENVTFKKVELEGFPDYKILPVDEIVNLSLGDLKEDIYKVVLKTPEDSTKFYSWELNTHVTPEFVLNNDGSIKSETVSSMSIEKLLEAYIDKNPPKNFGLPFDKESMLQLANGLIKD